MWVAGRHEAARAHGPGLPQVRCRTCGKQFNERSGGVLNRTQYPSDVIALVVLWRLRYKLSLRDLPEMFAIRGIVFSYEAVREWEAKLTPALAQALRRRRRGKRISAKGIYRDPVRSSHGHFVKASGLRWLSLMLGSIRARATDLGRRGLGRV